MELELAVSMKLLGDWGLTDEGPVQPATVIALFRLSPY